jgi:hypothetical protein
MRWTEAIALPNQEAATIAKAFVDLCVSRFGVPLTIHSDQSSHFTSNFLAICVNFCTYITQKVHHCIPSQIAQYKD